MIREVNKKDLDKLLQLYLYLHEKSIRKGEKMTNKGFTVENLLRYLKKLSGGSFPEGCAGAILLYQ